MSTSTSTPVVRVQLQLKSRDGRPADRPKELARMCTSKGVEVVQDVEGLMMIRVAKRKCQEQPPTLQEECNGAATGAPSAPAPSEAAAHEAKAPASPSPMHSASPQQQNQDSQPPDAQHSDGSEDQAGDQGAPDAEQQADPGWLLASHLSPPPQPPPLDLEAEVEKLKGFLPEQLPAASQVQWLLSQALVLAVNNTGGESAASVASSFMSRFQDCLSKRIAAAQQLLQQGGPAELEAFDRLPPFIRKLCASDRLAAALRQQLGKLQQEEKAWAALEAKYGSGAGAGEASSAPESVTGQGGGEVREEQQQQALVDLQPMVAVQERADMQLGFQVEAIHTMLERAELLVEQAQQACTLLQGDYHKENFQSYAHINSPQVLIKILSQAQGPTQPHASQQAAAGEDCVPATQACEG